MSPTKKGTKTEMQKGEMSRLAAGEGKPRGVKRTAGPGRPVSGRERVAVTLLLPPDLRRELRILKAKDDREMSDILEDALRAYLKERGHVA
jgi:hypothetical protein